MKSVYLQLINSLDISDEYVGWHSESHTSYYSASNRIFTKENILEELNNGIKNNNNFHYGIFYKDNKKLIGVIKLGIINWNHKTSDMIVFIGDKDYLGMGLAIEAIELGNEIAFKQHKLRKLYGGMYYNNAGSVKAYLRTGWVIEGVLKDQYLVNGESQDRILVACFNPDLFNKNYYRNGVLSFEDVYN
jgi:[ribosomal protein S5]-alanine N-acetyltransferase